MFLGFLTTLSHKLFPYAYSKLCLLWRLAARSLFLILINFFFMKCTTRKQSNDQFLYEYKIISKNILYEDREIFFSIFVTIFHRFLSIGWPIVIIQILLNEYWRFLILKLSSWVELSGSEQFLWNILKKVEVIEVKVQKWNERVWVKMMVSGTFMPSEYT